MGVNSDKVCYNGKSSLWYALEARNVQLVKAILQRGASPWSTKSNPYSKMLEEVDDEVTEEMKTLFANARKVYIGMQIQSTIQKRKKFWDECKGKIVEYDLLKYTK